ncbi:P-loop containing nucleoside triphosphate hydrolase protein, partial [Pyronema omphalodes]
MPPKRKNPSETGDTTITTPAKKRATRRKKTTADDAGSTTEKPSKTATKETSDIPWPPLFKHLEKVHRALNLVYTFCCTRKQLATTFSNLKAAVEGHIKKELQVMDIAQIKFLIPRAVHFEYVDEDLLQVYVAASSGVSGKKAEKEEIYSKNTDAPPSRGSEVLLFEFVDGDLKKSVVNKLDEIQRVGLRNEEIKMPTFSTNQMTKLINKRNENFESAVNKFLNTCHAAGEDPVESLNQRYLNYVPAATARPDAPQSTNSIPPDIPEERKSISEIIEEIKNTTLYVDQIVPDGHRIIDAQEAVYGDLEFVLSQHLVNAIYTAHDIIRFYSHQAEAINHIHDGQSVIVSTSTSSGKSLIYQVPVLHQLEQDRDTRAMFIFPTKALAQDQKRSLMEVLGYMTEVLGDVIVDTFDGDTPLEERRRIRDEASVIFTNPDMLHLTILPNEEHWREFLRNLKFVVVDELHVYHGIFGSHLALIMRRLRRICSAVGNSTVQFISCSATVSNPVEHMRNIFSLPSVQLVSNDGSPAGLKQFLLWNTPYKSPQDPSSGRADSIQEAARLFAQLILRGVRTIAFCRVRNACELLLQAVRHELGRLQRGDIGTRIMGYRGGYTAPDRRRIEADMFSGYLLGIVATNALELGVDIGSLDAVIIVGFPGSISSFRQQAGRAGRRNRDSLAVLVGGKYPLDQYYMSNPGELFEKKQAELKVDIDNPLVMLPHLQCAAYELPMHVERDLEYFGSSLPCLLQELVKDDTGLYHPSSRFLPYPAKLVPIRDIEDTNYTVINTTLTTPTVLETLEPTRAILLLYEGGIFLHQGRSFLIRTVDHTKKFAAVEAVNVSYTTSPREYTDITPVCTYLSIPIIPGDSTTRNTHNPIFTHHGEITTTTQIFGFLKLNPHHQILDIQELSCPSPVLLRETTGIWIDIPAATLVVLKSAKINAAAGIHAASHAVLRVMGMEGLRTECKAPEKEFAQLKYQTRRRRPARLVFWEKNREN